MTQQSTGSGGDAEAPSVDDDDVRRFTRLAELWWNAQGPFWPLHRLNGLRVGYVRDVTCAQLALSADAPHPFTALRVLDIGCGGGILSEAIARLGAEVHGVDVVARNIAIARGHAEAGGLDIAYETTSAEALAARGERYDLVLNMEVVEHVADLPGFFAACAGLVRPGGLMFVATLNRTLRSLLFAKFAAEYLLRWLPPGTHQWRRFRHPREIERLFARAGMGVVAGSGVAVNPLTRRFRLTANEAMNYMRAGYRSAVRSAKMEREAAARRHPR